VLNPNNLINSIVLKINKQLITLMMYLYAIYRAFGDTNKFYQNDHHRMLDIRRNQTAVNDYVLSAFPITSKTLKINEITRYKEFLTSNELDTIYKGYLNQKTNDAKKLSLNEIIGLKNCC